MLTLKNNTMQINFDKKRQKTRFSYNKLNINIYSKYVDSIYYKKFLIHTIPLLFYLD